MAADHTTEPASLLGLPPELRNLTYHYVAHGPGHVVIYQGRLVPHVLARVCRQTRHEFLPLFEAATGMNLDTIRAVVHNFEFRSLEQQLLRLHPSGDLSGSSWRDHRPDSSAEKTTRKLEVVIVADDAEEMQRNQKTVMLWHSRLLNGILGRSTCKYDCDYEVRVDYDALGATGVDNLRRKLFELRQPSGKTSLRLVPSGSSNRLEQELARWLETPIGRRGF